jgi:hypothetical protein
MLFPSLLVSTERSGHAHLGGRERDEFVIVDWKWVMWLGNQQVTVGTSVHYRDVDKTRVPNRAK